LGLAFYERLKIGVCGPAVLPYASQLLGIAELARRLGGEIPETLHDILERWFWRTTYDSWFTGKPGNRIKDEIENLATLADEEGTFVEPKADTIPALTSYYYQATRTKAFLLLLARSNSDLQAQERGQRALGATGPAAVEKVHPRLPSRSPESRVVCTAEGIAELRHAIRDPSDPGSQAILKRHLVSIEAAQALNSGDDETFLRKRGEALREMEREFLKGLDMALEEVAGQP